MKLLKLLRVGRSLNGGKRVSGNYKFQQIALPKFSSSALPSKEAAAKAMVLLAGAVPVPAAQNVPVAKIETGRALPAVSPGMDKTQKIPAGKILRRKADTVEISVQTKIFALAQKQIAKIKKRLFPVRSKKKSGAVPTQTEWNLEKVTVLRNDLSEADLEVVTPKFSGDTAVRKMHFPDMSQVKDSGRRWLKKTTGLFKTSSPFEAGDSKKSVRAEENERELADRL